MIGIFDSGVGGLNSLKELRRLRPDVDICYLADSENAPYGTKSEPELIELVRSDIDLLRKRGAEEILVGCCTASAVCPGLPPEYSSGVTPIIEPTAKEACLMSKSGRIGFLSTAYTKNSFAFENAIHGFDKDARVFGFIASELVELAERGERDGALSAPARSVIDKLASLVRKQSVDVLILGCTHFSYFKRELENRCDALAVSAASVGAREIARRTLARGNGKTIFINKKKSPHQPALCGERNKKWQITEEEELTMP
jgi:glutamate racemase